MSAFGAMHGARRCTQRLSASRVFALYLLVRLLGAQHAHAEAMPSQGLTDPRVRTALFNSDEVYRLHGYVGYEIDVQFEKNEVFVGLGAGDIEGLSFVAQDNHLFIKPRAANVWTNLTVLTSRRQYQFDYSSSARRPSVADADAIYALHFNYPPEPSAAEQQLTDELQHAVRPSNMDYWYCGSPALKPVAASDDGVHTRLRFAARSEQPAVFVENDDGSESLLNFSVDAGDVIVHRVVRRLIVRRGKLSGRISNEHFQGVGQRLSSGTNSPQVDRRPVEPAP